MIQARELMIGNWVSFNDNCDRYGKVIGVNSYDNIHIECDYTPDHSEIKVKNVTLLSDFVSPIPLMPEILEKCGCKWENDNQRHLQMDLPKQEISKRYLCFYYDDGVCTMVQLYMEDYFDGYFEVEPPQYVHQFQNLYYALTGTDLPITFN